MGADVTTVAAEMTPYFSAAVGAYGGAVLANVRDEAAVGLTLLTANKARAAVRDCGMEESTVQSARDGPPCVPAGDPARASYRPTRGRLEDRWLPRGPLS